MTFQPKYRGTSKVLDARKPLVEEWFQNQIKQAVKASTDVQKSVQEFVENEDIPFRCSVERSGHYYTWSPGGSDKYFYVFRIRTQGYKDARFVIRKDGTLNKKSLLEAVSLCVFRIQNERYRKGVLETNKEMWNRMFNMSPREFTDCYKVWIELSQRVEGKVTVTFEEHRGWAFRMKKTVRMSELGALIEKVKEVSDSFKKFGE